MKNFHPKRPHILISNDDGIHAPGIKFLWNALKDYADLTVVAPDKEQSARSLSITLRDPLHIDRINWGPEAKDIWSVTGTPADCVKLALSTIMDKKPDLIVSGINRGGNLGRNVLYSGTIAAAIEAVLQDLPAIAFSCQDYTIDPDYETAGKYVPYIVQHIMDHALPEGTLLNVNFPERKLGKFKGFKMARQGTDLWTENPDLRVHPDEGNSYYWLGSKLKYGKEFPDSDDAWIKQGYVTAVPIQVADLTHRDHIEAAKHRFESSFPASLLEGV